MGQAYLMRRGGAEIWLRAVSYPSAEALPERAAKNTIAVISDVPCGYVYVQAERPEDVARGDVWVRSGAGADIDIETAKASLEAGILYIEQYDGQAWKLVEAYIWDGEMWRPVSIPRTNIYHQGVMNEALVGSWDSKTDTKGVITWNADNFYLGYTGDQARYASVFTTKGLDLTDYSKLCVVVSGTSGTKEGAACVTKEISQSVTLETVLGKMAAYVRIPLGITDRTTYEADISALEGEHYIQIAAAIFKGTFHEIYLV